MERYFVAEEPGELRSGEVLEDIRELRFDTSRLSTRSFTMRRPWSERASHPWSIVLTQDCDIEWDFQFRQSPGGSESKRISHLLLCDLEDEYGIRADQRIKNNGERDRAKGYRDERWHYLPAGLTDQGHELPEFYIDFKRVFSVPPEFVYSAKDLGLVKRHGYLKPPWLQHLTHRFISFLGRVALPDSS